MEKEKGGKKPVLSTGNDGGALDWNGFAEIPLALSDMLRIVLTDKC